MKFFDKYCSVLSSGKICKYCKQTFTRNDSLNRHKKNSCSVIKNKIKKYQDNLINKKKLIMWGVQASDPGSSMMKFTRQSGHPHHNKKIWGVQASDPGSSTMTFTRQSEPPHHNKMWNVKASHPGSLKLKFSRQDPNPQTDHQPQPGTSTSSQSGHGLKRKAAVLDDGKKKKIFCIICKSLYFKNKEYSHMKSTIHKNKVLKSYCEDSDISIVDIAYKSRIITLRLHNRNENILDIKDFFKSLENKIYKIIEDQNNIHKTIKCYFELIVEHSKYGIDDEMIKNEVTFNTKNFIFNNVNSIDTEFNNIIENLETQSQNFTLKDSGWKFDKILHLDININKYTPLRGGSSYFKLSKFIRNKKSVLNLENNDEACFAWSVVAGLYPNTSPNKKNVCRTSSYPNYWDVLNINNLNFPLKLNDIPLFEKNNENISINVFTLEKKKIVGPLYHTMKKKPNHVNLLYVEKNNTHHYCLIKNLSGLISKNYSKHGHKIYICDGCLNVFHKRDKLENHSKNDCKFVRATLPQTYNNFIEFSKHKNVLPVPFIIYCDFEAILKPIESCEPNSTSYTQNVQEHQPSSFAYYIKCAHDDSLSKLESFRGVDCGKVFIEKLQSDLTWIDNILKKVEPIKDLTQTEKNSYKTALSCHICSTHFNGTDNFKVQDHCHLTGNYRGAAHNTCNLKFQSPNFVPIICHNLGNYDAHFIIKELGFDNEKIEVLAQNKEKYISFTKNFKTDQENPLKLRFIDSFKFMPSSLDKLSQNLNDSQMEHVKKFYPNINKFNLMRKKGIFPYDHIKSFAQYLEPALPEPKDFYNKLSKTHITTAEYNHAIDVWNEFDCKTLGEYSDTYLKSDVLLLADVFEAFRNTCQKTYKLDPAHYFTAPGLSWDAMLKMTKVKLELLTDIDMVHFIQKGIRGGLAQCSKRHSTANNKYMGDHFDNTSPSKYIMYLDANNLYGHAMSQSLPHSNFKWLNEKDVESFNVFDNNDESTKGYILEVDLEYPENLHEPHEDLPFCIKNQKPQHNLSNDQKLIASLDDKIKYVIHERNLRQCLKAGLKLKKIHRVLEFDQSAWLKPYIDLNTFLRSQALSAFEKDFYKFMNNSIFGKTIEDVEKRKDVKLVTHWHNIKQKKGANCYISKPNFNSATIISKNLVAIQMNRLSICYNKPIYIGFSVLEISKTMMYSFHYDYMKKKYNEQNLSLLYTDTDSLIYEIVTDDYYHDIRDDLDQFYDTSDYSDEKLKKFNLKSVNKKVLGKFKDEMGGKLILEFIGLRAKSYCLLTENDVEIRRQKGISRSVVEKDLTNSDYRTCLYNKTNVFISQYVFKSEKHVLRTQLIHKLALCPFDDKRYLIPNSVCTLPWYHKNIEMIENFSNSNSNN